VRRWSRAGMSVSAAEFGSTLQTMVYNSPRARRFARMTIVRRAHASWFVRRVEYLMSKRAPTNFIILGQQRTGSNLLRYELDRRCPVVSVRGEEFHPALRGDGDTVRDIAGRVFQRTDRELVVGCKIFYDHVTAPEFRELLSLDRMKVVHLRRRNWLRRFVSAEIAARRDWWIHDEQLGLPDVRDRAVVVELDRLFLDFRFTAAQQTMAEHLLSSSEVFDISYEELSEQLDTTLENVARFLGAPFPMPAGEPKLQRQNPEPLRLLVRNYDEVRQALMGTMWQRFLDPEEPA